VIDPMDRRAALALVRSAIAHVLGGPAPVVPDRAFFRHVQPAFVTLHRAPPCAGAASVLQGCIGSFADRPLGEALQRSAVSAAFEDPRAIPLSPADLDALDVEISLLSPPTPLVLDAHDGEESACAALRPGVDGVILRAPRPDGRVAEALFLPQVWESLPEPRAFLAQLRRKAGLPPGAWAAGTELERFTVEVLHDPPIARLPTSPS
jgi:AmmeMemoRadiSam system protein A